MKRLKSFLNTRKQGCILDVGTGNGSFIAQLTRLMEDYGEIVGIDNLQISVDTAIKNFQDNEKVTIMNMDAEAMTFDDGSFEVVCLSNSLHHLDDPSKIFQEMERVLAKYGVIIINEMIRDGLTKRQKSHLLIHHFAAEIDREMGSTHNETYKGVEVVQKLKELSNLNVKTVFEVQNLRTEPNTLEEMEWLHSTIDRLLKKVEDSEKHQYFKKKADKIRKHLKKYGFDSATQLVVVLG